MQASTKSVATASAFLTIAQNPIRSFVGYGVQAARYSNHSFQHGYIDHTSVYNAPRYATTILSVRKSGQLAMIGDGQMTQGNIVMKPNAVKVRRIGDDVIVGFAGATADAMTLMERLEGKLETYSNQLMRACVELAKDWRTEKYLRRLEAAMIVANRDVTLEITGMGDVIEPVDGVLAIGSGSPYATAAARALLHTDHSAMEIAERAMQIAGDMCIYTNHNFVKEEMETNASNEELLRLEGRAPTSWK